MYLIYIETHKLYALKENDESKKKTQNRKLIIINQHRFFIQKSKIKLIKQFQLK